MMQKLSLSTESACAACGLPGAFVERGWYDACRRCGWIDEPGAAEHPSVAYEANEVSLETARATWPARAAAIAAQAATSVLTITESAPASENRPDYALDGKAFGWMLWSGMPGATPFSPQFRGFAPALVEELLLERPASTPSGRVALYVCSECAEASCGFTSADVTRSGGRILWSAIGTETPDDVTDFGAERGFALTPARGPAGFAFDEAQYRAALLGALRR